MKRDGKNFRKWFRLRGFTKSNPYVEFGTGNRLPPEMPDSLKEYIKYLTSLPSINPVPYGNGQVNGPQLAIIGDDPSRKEVIVKCWDGEEDGSISNRVNVRAEDIQTKMEHILRKSEIK